MRNHFRVVPLFWGIAYLIQGILCVSALQTMIRYASYPKKVVILHYEIV